jgi:hypothetical protein
LLSVVATRFRFRPSRDFGETVPSSAETQRFAEELSWAALDEDPGDFAEVYVRFTLRNHPAGTVVSRRTGIIVVDSPNIRPAQLGAGIGPSPMTCDLARNDPPPRGSEGRL